MLHHGGWWWQHKTYQGAARFKSGVAACMGLSTAWALQQSNRSRQPAAAPTLSMCGNRNRRPECMPVPSPIEESTPKLIHQVVYSTHSCRIRGVGTWNTVQGHGRSSTTLIHWSCMCDCPWPTCMLPLCRAGKGECMHVAVLQQQQQLPCKLCGLLCAVPPAPL